MGMCCTDFDRPAFYYSALRRARKEYKCCECCKTIAVGETYEHVSGKWDYGIDVFRSCEKCADLRDSLSESTCVALGSLVEDYKNFLDDIGWVKYDEAQDKYLYPENHLRLNR